MGSDLSRFYGNKTFELSVIGDVDDESKVVYVDLKRSSKKLFVEFVVKNTTLFMTARKFWLETYHCVLTKSF